MRVAITGGAGFLGTRVARAILEAGELAVAGRPPVRVDAVALLDLVAPPDDLLADARVTARTGDVFDVLDALDDADVIVHLAAAVSGAAEADLDLGLRANVDATRAVLDRARGAGRRPALLYSSSLAVFGADPYAALPEVIADDTLPRPQSSYGIQKLIGEQLVADYTRRGLVRGRNVRLMTVSVRPGKPNAAASSFVSGIIREPIAGIRAVCPVPPDTPLAVASPRRTVAGILRAIAAGDAEWGSRTAMNLPALTTTPREMAEALDRVAGAGTSSLIDWRVDPAIEAIVASWPARFDAARARALGLEPDASFDDIVREHVADIGGRTW